MFVINITYKQSIDEIEKHLAAHIEFLKHHYAKGYFLASGRKNPRVGGVILADAETLAEIEAVVKLDPFHIHELADYEIIEFAPSMTAACLADYKEF